VATAAGHSTDPSWIHGIKGPDHPSRTRAFIAICLGLVPPSFFIQSITFELSLKFHYTIDGAAC
jgi:hypothetical protein